MKSCEAPTPYALPTPYPLRANVRVSSYLLNFIQIYSCFLYYFIWSLLKHQPPTPLPARVNLLFIFLLFIHSHLFYYVDINSRASPHTPVRTKASDSFWFFFAAKHIYSFDFVHMFVRLFVLFLFIFSCVRFFVHSFVCSLVKVFHPHT